MNQQRKSTKRKFFSTFFHQNRNNLWPIDAIEEQREFPNNQSQRANFFVFFRIFSLKRSGQLKGISKINVKNEYSKSVVNILSPFRFFAAISPPFTRHT
jgi:hypothetical protein